MTMHLANTSLTTPWSNSSELHDSCATYYLPSLRSPRCCFRLLQDQCLPGCRSFTVCAPESPATAAQIAFFAPDHLWSFSPEKQLGRQGIEELEIYTPSHHPRERYLRERIHSSDVLCEEGKTSDPQARHSRRP